MIHLYPVGSLQNKIYVHQIRADPEQHVNRAVTDPEGIVPYVLVQKVIGETL